MSKTRYEWTLFDFAILAVGAVVVPIYETSSAEQVEWILADSGATAVVVETAAHAAIVDEVRGAGPGPAARLADRGRRGRRTDRGAARRWIAAEVHQAPGRRPTRPTWPR